MKNYKKNKLKVGESNKGIGSKSLLEAIYLFDYRQSKLENDISGLSGNKRNKINKTR